MDQGSTVPRTHVAGPMDMQARDRRDPRDPVGHEIRGDVAGQHDRSVQPEVRVNDIDYNVPMNLWDATAVAADMLEAHDPLIRAMAWRGTGLVSTGYPRDNRRGPTYRVTLADTGVPVVGKYGATGWYVMLDRA